MRLLFVYSFFVSLAVAIWPLPTSYEHGNTVLWIPQDVEFYCHGAGARNVGSIAEHVPGQFILALDSDTDADPQDSSHRELKLRKRFIVNPADQPSYNGSSGGITGEDILDYAIKSAYNIIFNRNLYPWKFHPRDWEEPEPDYSATRVSRIDIKLLSNDPPNEARPLAGGVDESYTLELNEQGNVTLTANTSIGLARGLTTFTQLYYIHSNGKDAYTPLAPVKIFDEPKFEHRGINLDVSRNFFPVEDIKRQIDAIAYNKMNRLHLHVTDSQSWPLVIPSLPELSAKGAYRPDLVYTPEDFEEMQRHAAIQGVEMITEIDMPGHTSSIHYAFPDLIAAFNIQPDWNVYAAEPPSGTLKLNSTAVDDFLEKLLDDLLPRISPYSSYFHTGGDEVNQNAYTLDETVKSSDFNILQPLMQKFIDRNHDQVRSKGLTPVVWEEMLLSWKLNLGDDVVVQSWQSSESVAQIVATGHKALVGNYKYWVSLSTYLSPFISFQKKNFIHVRSGEAATVTTAHD